MNRPDYSISTPENVDLHLELAGLGNRIWAAFIDMTLIYLVIAVIIVIALIFSALLSQISVPTETKKVLFFCVIGATILVSFAFQFGYFIFFEKLWQGQTPGKRITQTRVIETNGQPVGWTAVIIRNLMRIVDVNLSALGIVVMIFDRNERRIGDFLGGTLVIRERQPELSARNLRLNTALPESTFVDSGQITPDEYHLLVSFLRRRQQLNPSSRALLAKQLSDYFFKKLMPENKGESSEIFLEKVYLAYSARAQENNSDSQTTVMQTKADSENSMLNYIDGKQNSSDQP